MKSLDKNKTKEPVDSKLNKTRSTGKSKELNSNYGESAINKPKELDWEKEFDKINLCGCTRICFGHKELSKQIKSFISSLLQKQKEKTIKDLIKDVKDHQDTAEDSKILAFWDQVSYWLNSRLNDERSKRKIY